MSERHGGDLDRNRELMSVFVDGFNMSAEDKNEI